MPLELDKRYEGFADTERLVPDFVAYARILFERFGDRVKYWITINEVSPIHVNGSMANHQPLIYTLCNCIEMHVDDFPESKYVAYTRSILLSHAKTVDMYRREFAPKQGGKIAITLNMDWVVPLDDSAEAKKATDIGVNHMFGMYADPICTCI